MFKNLILHLMLNMTKLFLISIMLLASSTSEAKSGSNSKYSKKYYWLPSGDIPITQEIKIRNKIDPKEPKGKKTYFVATQGVKEKRKPLINFNNMNGWKALLHGNLKAEIRRTHEEVLFDESSLKIIFLDGDRKNKRGNGYVELVPENPIKVDKEFDTVTLWKKWKFIKNGFFSPNHMAGRIFLRIEDKNKSIHEIHIGPLTGKNKKNFIEEYWSLLYGTIFKRPWTGTEKAGLSTLDRNRLKHKGGYYGSTTGGVNYKTCNGKEDIVFPINILSIVITPPYKYKNYVSCLYIDSLSCFKRANDIYIPRDQKPLPLSSKKSILPINKYDFKNTIIKNKKSYDLVYTGKDGKLIFSYIPKTGTLSDISVSWNGGKKIIPFSNGGVELCPEEFKEVVYKINDPKTKVFLKGIDKNKNSIKAIWEYSVDKKKIEVTYSFSISQKSLIIDIYEPTGRIAGFSFGHPEKLISPKLIDVPYITFCTGKSMSKFEEAYALLNDNNLFCFAMIDWYNSNATECFGVLKDNKKYKFNGGCRYLRKTDGKRNPFSERIFLNVSPNYQEILPTIPNPRGQLEDVSKYYFFIYGYPIPKTHKLNKSFGLDNIVAYTFSHSWLGKEQSSFFQNRVRPKLEKYMPEYIRELEKIGYKMGAYSMNVGIDASNPLYDEKIMARKQDMSYIRDVFNAFKVKLPFAYEWFIKDDPKRFKKYNIKSYFFDTYSAWQDSELVDFDARAYGAGKFRTGFEALAKHMLVPKKHNTFSTSEGRRTYMYAGFTDLDIASIFGNTRACDRDLLVDFPLLKIHPLCAQMGHMYFYGSGKHYKKPDLPSRAFEQQRAFHIALGQMMWQVSQPGADYQNCGNSYSAFLKNYYMYYALQQRYVPFKVTRIEYFDGNKPFNTSVAIKRGIYKKGRIHVVYENGLHVYVNYNKENDWEIRHDNKIYLLPPYGFLCKKGNNFIEYAILKKGKKLEYVTSPEYTYVDSHNNEIELPNIIVKGAIAIKRIDKNSLWLIPTGGYGKIKTKAYKFNPTGDFDGFKNIAKNRGCEMVSLRIDKFFPNSNNLKFKLLAFDDKGKNKGEYAFVKNDNYITIKPNDDFLKYKIVCE